MISKKFDLSNAYVMLKKSANLSLRMMLITVILIKKNMEVWCVPSPLCFYFCKNRYYHPSNRLQVGVYWNLFGCISLCVIFISSEVRLFFYSNSYCLELFIDYTIDRFIRIFKFLFELFLTILVG